MNTQRIKKPLFLWIYSLVPTILSPKTMISVNALMLTSLWVNVLGLDSNLK